MPGAESYDVRQTLKNTSVQTTQSVQAHTAPEQNRYAQHLNFQTNLQPFECMEE